VQVHPDDAYATHESAAGGIGKRKCGTSSGARGSRAACRLRPDVTPESFRRAIADARRELPRACRRADGRRRFCSAGTAHTIFPGVVLCEVQQHSTHYRVFDYNALARTASRAPSCSQALNVMGLANRVRRCDPVRITHGAVTELFRRVPAFATSDGNSGAIAAVTSSEHFDLLIFLDARPYRVR